MKRIGRPTQGALLLLLGTICVAVVLLLDNGESTEVSSNVSNERNAPSALPQSPTGQGTRESPVDGHPSRSNADGSTQPVARDDQAPDGSATNVEPRSGILRTLAAEEVLALIRELPVERSHASLLRLRNVDLSGSNLAGADLRYVDFEGSVFNGANLAKADLRHSNLEKTGFTGATLAGADIRQANLSFADLRGADLRNVNAAIVDVDDSIWGVTGSMGADLRDADLRGADLRGTFDMTGVKLDGAVYDRATRLPPASLLDPSASNMVFKESESSD